MECSDLAQRLDDLLDGRLHALGRKSLQEHLERCADCRKRHEHAVTVLEAVRKLTPPAPHPTIMYNPFVMDILMSTNHRLAASFAGITR